MSNLEFYPLTSERWADFEDLFGQHGAFGGCWCMWWRLKQSEFERQKGEGNKQELRSLVEAGHIPGILAYAQGRAVGWCSVAPRQYFPRLDRSRLLKPVDEQPVWSIVCFYVEKHRRNQGMTVQLLQAAVAFVREQGGKIVEGYPLEPKSGQLPAPFAYMGLAAAYKKAGFVECLRRSETRPIMRYHIR